MLRLRTLGGLSLSRGDGSGTTVEMSRHRLALLARLAAGGAHGVSRAALLLQFWPDSDEDRARRALSQIAYAVRKELGDEQLLLGTTELRLNPAVAGSDVAEFTTAVAAGEQERAIAVYGGAFLDGFYLRETPEFERWAEEERARLAQVYQRALDLTARAAHERGDWAAEVEWLRRLATQEPHSSRVALRLMEAYVASGDRGGALRFAQVHEAIVRSELGAAPDASITTLAGQLRRIESGATAATPPATTPAAAVPAERVAAVPGPAAPAAAVRAAAVAGGGAASGWRRWRTPGLVAAAVGLVAIALAGVLRAPRMPRLGETGHRDWIVVTDVVNATGDPEFDRALSVALTAGLDQSPRVTVMPHARIREALARMRREGGDTLLDEVGGREVARREGAQIVIVPSIGRAESTFVLAARVIDATTGAALATELARARGRSTVLDALDDLSRALRRDFGESARAVNRDAVPLPRVTTRSLDALEKYADGSDAFANRQYKEADELWTSAVAIDSDFAMAHVSLGILYYWYGNRRPAGELHFTHALRLLDRLPTSEQMLVRAKIEQWRGNRDAAITLYGAYLRIRPDDPATLFQLGYTHMRAHHFQDARDAFARLTAIDSNNYSAFVNLATSLRGLRDFRRALDAYHRAFRLNSDIATSGNINNEYGGTYVALDMLDSAAAVYRQMLAGTTTQRADGYQSLAFLDMWSGHYAAAVAHLDSAIVNDRALRDSASEARHQLFMVALDRGRGATSAAREHWRAFQSLFHHTYLEPTLLMWAGRLAARDGDRPAVTELLDTLARRARHDSQDDQAAVATVEGEVALLNGRRAQARAQFALALTLDPVNHEREAAAWGAFRDGDFAAAERLYRELDVGRDCCYEGNEFSRDALYWIGRVAEARGDPAAATAAYGAFIERWRDADSTLVLLRDAKARSANPQHVLGRARIAAAQ